MPVKFIGSHPTIEWVQTGFYSLDIALRKDYKQFGWPTRTFVQVYGPTSIGKCLGEGTKVLMFDGSIKVVEDIEVGELLMGVDSTPRKVLSTTFGVGNMYKVSQTRGMPYTVNEDHILSVARHHIRDKARGIRQRNRQYLYGLERNISVKDWMKHGKDFSHVWKGYKVAVEFSFMDVPIEPYFLGLWLGDGNSDSVGITTTDKEVIEYLNEYAERLGLSVNSHRLRYSITTGNRGYKSHANSLQNKLRELDVISNKHIPSKYLINSTEVRMQLLAGLIDSDGHLYNDNGGIEITQKNPQLASDIKFLCDTLGLRTSIKYKQAKSQNGTESIVYRILVSGDFTSCPIRIERKKINKVSYKNPRLTGINVAPIGLGVYYGFELDGDGLFLLEDMTVTHNSTFINSVSCILAQKLELAGISCLDLEPQDPKTIETICENLKYDGVWKWVSPDKRKKEENISDEYLLGLLRKDARDGYVTILDSVAQISPVSEQAGEIGDANMGRRAFSMAQYSRLMTRELKWAEKGAVSFLANHKYEDFTPAKKGALQFAKASHAPGGVVKDNAIFINIEARVAYIDKKKAVIGDGWVFEGKVKKNRFGLSGSDFWVFIVGGQGIHKGMTSIFDCIKLGYAVIKSGNILVMKDTGEEFGRLSKIVAERDTFDFSQFENILKAHQLSAEDDAKLKQESSDDVEYTQDEE